MRCDAAGNPLDVDGYPLRVGDRILSVGNTGEGHEFTVVDIDERSVRVSGSYACFGRIEMLDRFGKYAEDCRLAIDPEIRLDVGW